MKCPKCQGLCVEESERDGCTLKWQWKCLNCGKRTQRDDITVWECNRPIFPDRSTIDKFNEKRMIDDKPKPEPLSVPKCSVPGCKKPKADDSVQCVTHRNKALRNNLKYRERSKMAMSGTADGATWKSPVLVALVEQRELAAAKLAEIDRAITTIKGL